MKIVAGTMDCGHFVTGGQFGKDKDGRTHYYDCCSKQVRQEMKDTGRICLYLDESVEPALVSNWLGTLRFPVRNMRKGRHNIARVRYDFNFRANEEEWYGTVYGNWTQVAHCRRYKQQERKT